MFIIIFLPGERVFLLVYIIIDHHTYNKTHTHTLISKRISSHCLITNKSNTYSTISINQVFRLKYERNTVANRNVYAPYI